MAVYTSTVPRALGLNHLAGQAQRLIGPGDDFTANAAEIPQGFLDAGWIKLVSADPTPAVDVAPDADPAKGKSK